MAEIWVVDASALIVLAKIGQLELLCAEGRVVLVPTAVVEEVTVGAARIALERGELPARPVVVVPSEILEWSLGSGGSAVIALAWARGATAVLDDAEARSCARAFGIPVIGTLGAVLRARREGRIPAAAPLVRALLNVGLRIDAAIIREALKRTVGEEWPD